MGACDIAAAAAAVDDLDALISAVKKADSVCSFVTCKASVLTLGQLCLHCNRQYCLSHHIPEVRHQHVRPQPLTMLQKHRFSRLNDLFRSMDAETRPRLTLA